MTERSGFSRPSKSFAFAPERRDLTLSELRTAKPVRLEQGSLAARERSTEIDRALSAIAESAFAQGEEVAIVAVGGYGRGELAPHSDIDLVVLVTSRTPPSKATIRGILYPLWDAGWQVGHAVLTPRECVARCLTDLNAATSLLSARLLFGNARLFEEMNDRRARWLKKDAKHLVRMILEGTAARHEQRERAGWTLAPDLKEDVGGLRDIHVVRWLEAASDQSYSAVKLDEAGEVLTAAREALHAELKRKNDRMHLDLQPAVAKRLRIEGDSATDELMSRVHGASRAIEHETAIAREVLSEGVLRGPRRSGAVQHVADGLRIEDGRIELDAAASGAEASLAALAAVATTGRSLSRKSISTITKILSEASEPKWSRAMLDSFLQVLRGPNCIAALEMMEHSGGWTTLLPEWDNIRSRAQHDPYHRYTVDWHSFLAVAQLSEATNDDPTARDAVEEAGDLRSLFLGTLFHDIGKGSGEDHSQAGEHLARRACSRMQVDQQTADEVAWLVRHHLLLADTATRRDLDDGGVIRDIADWVGDARLLRLLYVLTIADARATGPGAWGEWKAALVRELYRKALIALETGEVPTPTDVTIRANEVEAYEPSLAGRAEQLLATLPPSYLDSSSVEDIADDMRLLLRAPARGEIGWRLDDGTETGQRVVTVCVPDRPGTLARTAGVLALHRLPVLRAQAFSTSTGLALERFVIVTSEPADWDVVASDLQAAYAGRMALEARLEQKAADYRPAGDIGVSVTVLHDASPHSTVLEVRARDALGLLYSVASAMSDLDLDIHVAKIDTLGERVVDTFYVRTSWGDKLDAEQADEATRAIEHRVARFFRAG